MSLTRATLQDVALSRRAYSIFEIKAVDDEQRIIEGIASTPMPDRDGDIMEPDGAEFSLPLPLLWQHQTDQPIGHVLSATANASGIRIRAQIAKGVLPQIDDAWALIKGGLVRGLSVGFKAIEAARIASTGGYRITKWAWLELSAVTIPANQQATILSVKRAALGASSSVKPSGVADTPRAPRPPGSAMHNYSEKITALLSEKQPKAVRMSELMQPVIDGDAESLTATEQTEYDGLKADVKSLDQRIDNLKALEMLEAPAAKPVKGTTPDQASDARAHRIEVKSTLPKGTAFTRYAIAIARAKGNVMQAAHIAKAWRDSTPEVEMVLKTAVDVGTTTDAAWAGNLVQYQNMASEFIELLRAQTIIGRINGFRRVPFNVSMPSQTAGTLGAWVGQNKPKPVGKAAFGLVTLKWAKAAGIVVLSDELVRFSNPSAEAIISSDLRAGIAQFLDEQFLDPSVAPNADVNPASITYTPCPNDTASGVSADDLRVDVKAAFASFLGAHIAPAGSVWVMEPTQAVALSMMLNPLGQPEFPGVTVDGGTLFGLPVITSESVPSGQITLLKPSEILLADDGGITLDVSREASLQLDDAPSDGEQQVYSLWQNNAIGLRAERYINWKVRRAEAVYYISSANYGGAS